jgi:hypothetical protein
MFLKQTAQQHQQKCHLNQLSIYIMSIVHHISELHSLMRIHMIKKKGALFLKKEGTTWIGKLCSLTN